MEELFTQLDRTERALFDAIDAAATQVGLAVFVVRVDVRPVVVHASEMLARSTGRSVSELVGLPPWELVAPEDRERVREIVTSRGPGAPPIAVAGAVLHPDGTRRHVEVGVARVRAASAELAICFLHDVTGERIAVDALRRSEARFRSLIEKAPDGVVILRQGRIVLANGVAARLLGESDDGPLRGRLITDFLPPDDAARAVERMARIASGAMLGASEYQVHGDRPRVIEIHSIPCEWEGGPAILAFARDVTERKRLQVELDRGARLAAVGTMAAAVAHEVNNPLTYVRLSLEWLDRELEAMGTCVAREHAKNALHGIERVAAIIRDLRGFSGDQGGAPCAVDVSQVATRALRMVEHDLKHRARLTRRFDDDVPPVVVVASRLEQVVVNLLINAIQALPAGDPTRDEITVEVRGRQGEVVLVVRDTGVGIAAEDRERVFDAFFTTKPVGEGTGLGLVVCKRIVEDAGGSISLGKAPGGGTEVTVTLPASTAAVRATEPDDVSAPRTRLRVLVIDDEPLIRRTIKMALSQHHDVEDVVGGEAALEALEQRSFDVILCDVMMPGMNGREVHERIRARHPGLERRIVLVTGGAFASSLAEFVDGIDNPKLYKPFTEAGLLHAVATAAAR